MPTKHKSKFLTDIVYHLPLVYHLTLKQVIDYQLKDVWSLYHIDLKMFNFLAVKTK